MTVVTHHVLIADNHKLQVLHLFECVAGHLQEERNITAHPKQGIADVCVCEDTVSSDDGCMEIQTGITEIRKLGGI